LRRGVRLSLDQLQPYLFTLPEPGTVLQPSELFGNAHPVELEVGFGKGTFLVEIAPQHPEKNYLGIEIDRGLQLYVANRLAKRQLTNVRVAAGDAGRLVEQLSPHSLSAVHVYFPDPWWKKRHRKRRVFNEAFVQQCARVLQPGGHLYLATDVAEYFQVMMGILAEQRVLVPLHAGREESVNPTTAQTNFEKKAHQQGRPVWRATFIFSDH
jgi:tRNA (guanine-N7-)-methyltransferase